MVKGCGVGLDQVLAAHFLAAVGQDEAAAVDGAEGLPQPSWLASIQCAPLASWRCASTVGAPAQALRSARCGNVGDDEGGVRGGGAGRSRHSGGRRGTAPQLTISRSRPTENSIDSVPAWAKRSSPAAAARRSRRTARCARPAGGKAALAQRRRAAAAAPGLGEHKVDQGRGVSSLLPLNSASPPSPWRSARSAGAMRSMAVVSAGGGWRCAPAAGRGFR